MIKLMPNKSILIHEKLIKKLNFGQNHITLFM